MDLSHKLGCQGINCIFDNTVFEIYKLMEEQLINLDDSPETVLVTSLAQSVDMGSIGRMVYRREAMKFLGVLKPTILRYEKRGILKPIKNVVNGKVMYTEANILTVLGSKLKQTKQVVLYCRSAVLGSRSNQGNSAAKRLADQIDRMQSYCVRAGIRVDTLIQDIGPVTGNKALAGHDKLLEMIIRKQVSLLVVETEDRIARWGMSKMFYRFLEWHGVEVHIASPILTREEYREEIKQDLTELIYEARELIGETV